MTTAEEELRPPEPPGPLTWMRKNLFSSWFDGILTIIGVLIIFFVVWTVGDWIINQANWAPVLNFPLLYLIGQYPRDQMWRVALTLWTVSFLFGMSWGTWGKLLRTFALALGIFLGVLTLY
ncbi:MAG: hypothetical protein R3335_08225, partial [Anaerolineales bacterium]|nr:hypothetical protein [Anaerolineales bacterium]